MGCPRCPIIYMLADPLKLEMKFESSYLVLSHTLYPSMVKVASSSPEFSKMIPDDLKLDARTESRECWAVICDVIHFAIHLMQQSMKHSSFDSMWTRF